jgi:plastocyanin
MIAKKPVLLVVGLVVIGGLAVVGVKYVTDHYLSTTASAASTVACPVHGVAHEVVMQNNLVAPIHTTAKLCDTLTIKNDDNILRLVAFGPHEDHTAYDGITEQYVSQNQSVTVVLNQAGTYYFHDHLHDDLKGDFTVSP